MQPGSELVHVSLLPPRSQTDEVVRNSSGEYLDTAGNQSTRMHMLWSAGSYRTAWTQQNTFSL